MTPKPIVIIQGAQFGSEAKGAIAAKLCVDRDINVAVRTGAINAGHTVVYKGQKFAMQQIPTGWINPNTLLVIGAGAYVHPDTLWREIDMINAAMPESDVRLRLVVDERCGVHNEEAEKASKTANRHHSIGATGKGCSEAIVAKIRNRNAGYQLFKETAQCRTMMAHGLKLVDTVHLLHRMYDQGGSILIEGTQGTLLDLHLGPYPFTTSRMTTAANWVAEAGLSPSMEYEVVLVARTYPIRVAGNSGPMSNEIEWVDLARSMNRKMETAGLIPPVSESALGEFERALQLSAAAAVLQDKYKVPNDGRDLRVRLSEWTPEERSLYRVAASELHRDALQSLHPETLTELKKLFEMTTVTKKLRRVAEFTRRDLEFAIKVNRPDWIALTFGDYVVPQLAGATEQSLGTLSDIPASLEMVNYVADNIETPLGVEVQWVSFGPAPENVVSTGRLEQAAAGIV